MFDEILQAVKTHFANDPQIAAAVPADQHEALHNEIATHIANNMAGQPDASGDAPTTTTTTTTTTTAAATEGGLAGIWQKVETEITSNNPIVNAVSGGLISSLASKFGLGPAATGAIAASLPGLLQKLTGKGATTAPPAPTA